MYVLGMIKDAASKTGTATGLWRNAAELFGLEVPEGTLAPGGAGKGTVDS